MEKDNYHALRVALVKAVVRSKLASVEQLHEAHLEEFGQPPDKEILELFHKEFEKKQNLKHKLLLAEDDPSTLVALSKTIKNWGYQVFEATDGEEAWEILSSDDPPRIALLDWMMPKLSGLELCRRIQSRKDGLLIYTILLTSKINRQDLIKGLDGGAHEYLRKPTYPDELYSRIAVGCRLVEEWDRLTQACRQAKLPGSDEV